MDSVGKYQIVHADGTRLSPVDMATLAEMVYAGIVQTDTELFAVASSRTIKAGEIPYLAFLISRLKESPSAPPPRLPVAEPARAIAPTPAPRQARAPRQPQPSTPEPLYTEAPVAPPPAIVLPDPEPEPEPVAPDPVVFEAPEPTILPVLEPEPEPIVVEELPALAPENIEAEPDVPELEAEASIVETPPLPEPVAIPVAESISWESPRDTLEPLTPLVFETPPAEPVVSPELELELEPEPDLALISEAYETPEIPVLEITTPELPQEAEPVHMEVATAEAPVLPEPPAIIEPELETEPETVAPQPEPVEIALEIHATAPPQPLPAEVLETIAEPVVETPPAPAPEPELAPEWKKAKAEPPKAEDSPPKAPPEKQKPSEERDPNRRAGESAKRRKTLSAQQKRTYTIITAIALPALIGYVAWQQISGATAQKQHQAIVGAWEDKEGTSVVFKDDGTGAQTRPDPIYGNRTYLFRWERRGSEVRLTEKRILMPGGTRQTAPDSSEPVGLSPDGMLLHFGDKDLAKVP